MTGTRQLTLSLVAIVLLLSAGGGAYKRAHSQYGRPLFWQKNTITLVVQSLPSALGDQAARIALENSVRAWTKDLSCTVPLTLAPGQTPAGDKTSAPIIWVRVVSPWKRAKTLAAWTEVESHPDRGQIVKAVIELNPNIAWDAADPVAPTHVDFESILTHEIGHALGLAHSYDRRALMRAGIKPGERKRDLKADDRRGICEVFR